MAWYFVQTLMGCIGSVGFAVLFNIRGRKLLLAAGGGALAWAVYLACTCNGLDIFAGLFFATLAAALASELLGARRQGAGHHAAGSHAHSADSRRRPILYDELSCARAV